MSLDLRWVDKPQTYEVKKDTDAETVKNTVRKSQERKERFPLTAECTETFCWTRS